MKYFDGIDCLNKQDDNDTRYPITDEYYQSLLDEINEYPSDEDVCRITPDENGKPIVTIIEVDYLFIYRKRRNQECFPTINRGTFWYNTLTEEQKTEIQV